MRQRQRPPGTYRRKLSARAFRNGDITPEFALFMSCRGTPAGITDGRRGCKAMMAVYRWLYQRTAPVLSSRNDDNTLRASCLKRQLPELNTQPPVIMYPLPPPPPPSPRPSPRARAMTPTPYESPFMARPFTRPQRRLVSLPLSLPCSYLIFNDVSADVWNLS